MHDGKMVETGPVDQVYVRPQHACTRRLVAVIPTLRRALAGVGAADRAAGARPSEEPT